MRSTPHELGGEVTSRRREQLAREQGKLYDKASGRRLIERIKSEGRAARAKKR